MFDFKLKIKLMLELQKFVLQQVCEDARLFKKELIKSIMWLSIPDVENLKHWVLTEYGNRHSDIIKEVFCLVKI